MAGLAEALKREQEHHEIEPQAMYADAGYVTENTLSQAEQNGMELLGPTRPDPHKGPYNTDAFKVESRSVRPFVLREKPARSRAGFEIPTWEPSTTALNGAINATAVQSKTSVRVPRMGAESW